MSLAEEIRTALEGVTPGPWEWDEQYDFLVTEDGSAYVIAISAHGDEIIADRHDRALIAAAPVLLARAADRIEQLEAELRTARAAWVDLAFPKPTRIAKEGA